MVYKSLKHVKQIDFQIPSLLINGNIQHSIPEHSIPDLGLVKGKEKEKMKKGNQKC